MQLFFGTNIAPAIVQATGCIAKLVFYAPAREELLAGDVVEKLDRVKIEAGKSGKDDGDSMFAPADARAIRSNIIAALFNLDPKRYASLVRVGHVARLH